MGENRIKLVAADMDGTLLNRERKITKLSLIHILFSFQDMFSQKALYGDMEEFVRILKEERISEVHYIGNLEKKLDFIPGFVTTPWMISGMGIIYGKK